jgi:aminoglycoside phosphotransferase (APT) family kinase protein
MRGMTRGPIRALAPAPLAPGDAELLCSAAGARTTFRAALEELLLALPLDRAERLMQTLREGRGAWIPLLGAAGGRALFVGNALSGTSAALARAGFEVAVADPVDERRRFGAVRDVALAGRAPRAAELAELADSADLKGRAAAAEGPFDLVVLEEGLAGDGPWPLTLAAAWRLTRGELGLVGDNRLGYKRSTGARGSFELRGPLALARALVSPRERQSTRTLAGWRRAFARAGATRPEAFALYPHRGDFAHVVALDQAWPRLYVGPKEARNRAKILAQRAGLFPHLAPSYLLLAARGEPAGRSSRLQRILGALARATGEPEPRAEMLFATRGNTALVQTRVPGAPEDAEPGRWTLHLPLQPAQEEQARRHLARLVELRRRFPAVPVPEPLVAGTFEGLYVTCERRLAGLSAPQLTGDAERLTRTWAQCAEKLALLALGPPRAIDRELFGRLFAAKLELAARYAAVEGTRRWIARALEDAERRALGLEVPLVVYHADLRAKHVQVDGHGNLLGFLDWGSSEDQGLPYFDLLNLLLHERKQEAGLSAGEAWELVRGWRGLRAGERSALADYAARLCLPAEYLRLIEDLHPALVAAMAEANWDYSRPRWLARNWGV